MNARVAGCGIAVALAAGTLAAVFVAWVRRIEAGFRR